MFIRRPLFVNDKTQVYVGLHLLNGHVVYYYWYFIRRVVTIVLYIKKHFEKSTF